MRVGVLTWKPTTTWLSNPGKSGLDTNNTDKTRPGRLLLTGCLASTYRRHFLGYDAQGGPESMITFCIVWRM